MATPPFKPWKPFRDTDFILLKDAEDMKYSDPKLLQKKPAWLVQTHADLQRHEGFRAFAYPDPLSKLGKKYRARSYNWGYEPGDILLAKYGESEKDGRPWTIGYGETRGVTPRSRTSKVAEDQRLEQRILDHVVDLPRLVPNWLLKPLYVQTVLANLIYNLGTEKLAKFDTTLRLFNEGKYTEAGKNLRKTAWFKQVGTRAVELVNRLETGKIDPSHLVVR